VKIAKFLEIHRPPHTQLLTRFLLNIKRFIRERVIGVKTLTIKFCLSLFMVDIKVELIGIKEILSKLAWWVLLFFTKNGMTVTN